MRDGGWKDIITDTNAIQRIIREYFRRSGHISRNIRPDKISQVSRNNLNGGIGAVRARQ